MEFKVKIMNIAFWKNKKVFITGHTGFKGSWLSLWLQQAEAHLVGFALPPPTTPSLYELARIDNDMNSITGDIRDFEQIERAIRTHKPEIVFHMAAQSLVRPSYSNPLETYATNVMGTVNLLEAVRRNPSAKVVVNITSDKCYDNKEWVWGYREEEPMGGHDPYSNSKGCSELVTSAFRNSFFHPSEYSRHGVAMASARAGNVIGGGDWAKDRLIPDIVRALEKQEKAVIRNPQAIRPWQHVLEPLSGYLLLAEKMWENGAKFSEPWNFGPNDEESKPVRWVADRLTGLWGEHAGWVSTMEDNHLHEATYLKLDSSKARLHLGWRPQWTLDTALKKIVDWHHSYRSSKNMRRESIEQIHSFCLKE